MVKDTQSGLTLIELLAAVVLMGIVIIPVLSVLTSSFERTVSQGNDSQLQFFAQEIIEETKLRIQADDMTEFPYVESGQCTVQDGCTSGITDDSLPTYELNVAEAEYGGVGNFVTIDVEVLPSHSGDKSIQLMTVMRQ